jgi:phage/plasmid-associated DNA primase
MDVMGKYATSVKPETILEKKYDQSSTNDLAELKGMRLVSTSETKQNQTLNEGLIKRITGEDRIKCRFLYQEYFEYVPEFKLVLLTNHEPNIKSNDNSMWRRVLKVPFNVEIPREERDKHLRKKLLKEGEGVFNWLVQGAVEWYKNGLDVPEEVRIATEEYQKEFDIIGYFLETCTEDDPYGIIPMSQLYEIYEAWCDITKNPVFSLTAFGRSLTERKYEVYRTKKLRFRRGLKVAAPLREKIEVVWLEKDKSSRKIELCDLLKQFMESIETTILKSLDGVKLQTEETVKKNQVTSMTGLEANLESPYVLSKRKKFIENASKPDTPSPLPPDSENRKNTLSKRSSELDLSLINNNTVIQLSQAERMQKLKKLYSENPETKTLIYDHADQCNITLAQAEKDIIHFSKEKRK